MMLLPGFGSTRLPMRVRSQIAIAVSLALFPIVSDDALRVLSSVDNAEKAGVLVAEIAIGISFGLIARLFMLGLQFSATVLTNTINLAPTPGAPIDDSEAQPPLVSFISLCGTMIVFATDLHLTLLRGLVETYSLIKVGAEFEVGWHFDMLVGALSKTFEIGLRLSSPFIVYSILVNLSIGFINKFTPQISVYFVTTGMVAAGGLMLLYFSIDDWLSLFQTDFNMQFG
jgi:flagellar biosynthesis protein FliR